MDPDLLTALAEPTRLKIVEVLREQPRSVNEIALLLGLSQPQASKHLHRLSQAGLVRVKPVAQQRIYMLNEQPFLQLEDWVSSFHHSWNRRFDDLEKHLKKGQYHVRLPTTHYQAHVCCFAPSCMGRLDKTRRV